MDFGGDGITGEERSPLPSCSAYFSFFLLHSLFLICLFIGFFSLFPLFSSYMDLEMNLGVKTLCSAVITFAVCFSFCTSKKLF